MRSWFGRLSTRETLRKVEWIKILCPDPHLIPLISNLSPYHALYVQRICHQADEIRGRSWVSGIRKWSQNVSLTSTSRPLCYKQGSSCKHAGYWKYIASVKFIWRGPSKTTKQPKTNKSSNQMLLNKSLPTNSSWNLTRPQIELGNHPCPALLHLCREAWASLGQVVKFVRMMVKTSGIPLKRSINLASWVMYT